MNPRPGQYSEDQLVEQPAIRLFEELGWEHVNAYRETLGPHGTLGRDNMVGGVPDSSAACGHRAPQSRDAVRGYRAGSHRDHQTAHGDALRAGE